LIIAGQVQIIYTDGMKREVFKQTAGSLLAGVVIVSALIFTSSVFAEGDQESETPETAAPEQANEDKGEDKPSDEESPFTERKEERLRMVERQIASREVSDPDVLEAMRTIPRHRFVPEAHKDAAYTDQPLPIGHGQTISQPYIVAYMTEQLELDYGEKVLEIGTGSGYQAAVLAAITNNVYTIEIIEPLAETAEEQFEELGLTSIKTKTGDGYYGWEEYSPFDAIIVTAAAGHVPPPLIKQLKSGGRIVIPVGGVYQVQTLMLITKQEDGSARSRQLLPVRFVPMTGRAQKGRE
jgi:protein-L-isoaspartate(D-aspartate) O-methyltransferase